MTTVTVGLCEARPGTIRAWGGLDTTPPPGWLYCDGSAISRTTYAALFATVSTYFGVGDNSTTFNIPDFREKFPRGGAAAAAPGATGGTPTHDHSIVDSGAGQAIGAGNPDACGAHSHGGATGAADTLPPYQNVHWIIKT